jgi:hypothetical protein
LDSKKIKVSKQDAARRQINSAITLYFSSEDPVSTHTLACAANGILKGLDEHGPNTGTYQDRFLKSIKTEHRKFVRDMLSEAQNFFKRADRDPEKVLEFLLAEPEYVFASVCSKYRESAKDFTPEMLFYETWFGLPNPEVLTPDGEERFRKLPDRQEYTSDQKGEFFMKHMAARQSILQLPPT